MYCTKCGPFSSWAVAATIAIYMGLAPGPGFAQAGSMGGAIGKQGKSVSGSDEVAPRPKRQKSAPVRAREPKRSPTSRAAAPTGQRGFSLSGLWNWTAHCDRFSTPYVGTFMARHSGAEFTGTHGNTNMWDSGTIANGHVEGNRVSFDRTYAQYTDHVAMTVVRSGSGLRMSGVIPNTAHSGRCVMNFTKTSS
jgi:hypothetical protein